MSFIAFRNQVNSRIQTLINQCDTLLEVDIDREELWNYYLDSFPAGSNALTYTEGTLGCPLCEQTLCAIKSLIEEFKYDPDS